MTVFRKSCCLILASVILCSGALALEPISDTIYQGMDVSAFRGNIDFERARADGIEAVYIRAGLGSDYVDPYYRANAEKASAAGMRYGFYYYVTAVDGEGATDQAEKFYDLIKDFDYDMLPALDFEEYDGKNTRQINEIGLGFMTRLEELTGRAPVLYTDAYAADRVWDADFGRYPLWVADWGVEEPNVTSGHWAGWSGFQYRDDGRVDGVSGDVDMDRYTDGLFVEPTPPPQDVWVYHTVRTGETLSGIASDFETTVAALVAANGIADPNLIYIGQVLKIPGGDRYIVHTVVAGDTLYELAVRYGTTVEILADLNRIANINLITVGQVIYIPK